MSSTENKAIAHNYVQEVFNEGKDTGLHFWLRAY